MSDRPLRVIVGETIMQRFEETQRKHGIGFDPDTVWEATDDVLAVLAGTLLGQHVSVLRDPQVIGTIGFETQPTLELIE